MSKIRIKRVIWINDQQVVVWVSKKKKILKKINNLRIVNGAGEDAEVLKSDFSRLTDQSGEDGSLLRLELSELKGKPYNKLHFQKTMDKYGNPIEKNWKRIRGTIEPYKQFNKRMKILEKAVCIEDIDLKDVYGFTPTLKEYFFKHNLGEVENIISMRVHGIENYDFIKRLPGTSRKTFEQKQEKVSQLKKELKYLKKEIKKNNQ